MKLNTDNKELFLSLGLKHRPLISYLIDHYPSLANILCRHQLGGDNFFDIPSSAKVLFFPMSDNFEKFIKTPSDKTIYIPNSFLISESGINIQEYSWLKTYRYEDFSVFYRNDSSAIFIYLIETDLHKPNFMVKSNFFGKNFFLPLTLISFVAIAKNNCIGWDNSSKRWVELSLQLEKSDLENDQRVITLAQLCTTLVVDWFWAGRESLWHPSRITRFLAENTSNNAILQREIMLMIVEDCFQNRGWNKEKIQDMKSDIQNCFARINEHYESA